MRAFLAPQALLISEEIYIAALHSSESVARPALQKWLSKFDPELLPFQGHKLLGIAATRFPEELSRSTYAGVLANVARQARLRTHAAFAQLARLLERDEFADTSPVAVGETHERVALAGHANSHLETLELAVRDRDLDGFLAALRSSGFESDYPPRTAWGRRARISISKSASTGLHLRVLGLAVLPDTSDRFGEIGRLRIMTPQGHARFMRSRLSGLLARRDQVLFDLYRMRAAGGDVSDLASMLVRTGFRRQALTVLGRN